MDRLPSSIIIDIFSRVPIKFLARSRCVSKVWCEYIGDSYLTTVHDKRVIEDPIPILYHTHVIDHNRVTSSLCFHIIESKQPETGTTDHTYVLEPKEDPVLEFLRKKPLYKALYYNQIEFRGSCNGLMCLSQTEDGIVTMLAVVHPLRKECYELPPLLMCRDSSIYRESCGLGFDASTNTLKMVCVLFKEYPRHNGFDMLRKHKWSTITREDLCTMVHVIGTNSWKEIPQVPPYPIGGNSVFVNGCLHWLAANECRFSRGSRPVIWFDVEKEEFGLIDPPKRQSDLWRDSYFSRDHLVNLNGEVGYVCVRTKFVWVLKQTEWVPLWQIVLDYYVEVLGCWNKDGDMLIQNYTNDQYKFFVYNLKSGLLHKTSIAVPSSTVPYGSCSPNIFLHPNKLFSIHGIGRNSFPMRKPSLKKSCRRLPSFC